MNTGSNVATITVIAGSPVYVEDRGIIDGVEVAWNAVPRKPCWSCGGSEYVILIEDMPHAICTGCGMMPGCDP